MTFLEAHKILRQFKDGVHLRFLFATSGLTEKLDIFLKATAAHNGYRAEYSVLPFNTLQQAILMPSEGRENEVFVLFPWDLVPATDWRSGFSRKTLNEEKCYQQAQSIVEKLLKRKNARFIYVPAQIPPVFFNSEKNQKLEVFLIELMRVIGATFVSQNIFSLASYLDNGCPFSGTELGNIAKVVIHQVISKSVSTCKVLVTDLDNVMWSGVIGEDGIEGIKYESHGLGYKFFIYQTYLRKLKNEGILLAAVSRNDNELALMPFGQEKMVLKEDDFISIIASYNAKSSQISELAKQLNLGLDSFVFVDDNPIELAEVSKAIPEVNCILFPLSDEKITDFYATLSSFFNQSVLTDEDKKRTEMYKHRLKGITASDKIGANLSEFLIDLEMELTIYDRSEGDRTRAVQLINKTNQFNLNGVRVIDDEVNEILNAGGKIFSASLTDKHGDHGEILSCLIERGGRIRSYVLSCRVFQRRIEYAFLAWLVNKGFYSGLTLDYIKTERNGPIDKFLGGQEFIKTRDGQVMLDTNLILSNYKKYIDIFKLHDV